MLQNLRAPPKKRVLRWGRQLNLTLNEINAVSSNLSLRQQLGTLKNISLGSHRTSSATVPLLLRFLRS